MKSSYNINRISRKANGIVNAILMIYSLVCIVPVMIVLSVSLSSENSIHRDGYSFIPRDFTWKAYDFLFADYITIANAYGVSIFVTVVGTVLGICVMALYAYPISRRDFEFKAFFSFYMFIPMLFSGGLVSFYLMYTQILGLKDSLWALIIPGIVNTFYVLVMRTFFANTIPPALIEAAKIDGAGEFTTFARIIIPLSMPVLATIALFSTLGYWNEWFLSMIFIDSADKVSLQYLMYKTLLNIQYITNNSKAMSSLSGLVDIPSETVRMAMCVVGMGPIILVYPFFQKYFVKGLTIGAVKG